MPTLSISIKGQKVDADILREDEDYFYVSHAGKEYKRKKKKVTVPKFDRDVKADYEKNGNSLVPSRESPICKKCGLDLSGSTHPYLSYAGPEHPLITLVVDGVSKKEDSAGLMGSNGPASFIISEIIKLAEKFKFSITPDQIRVATLTRCARCAGPKMDLKTKGRWCRNFLVQDLDQHRPQVIIPVGSTALGALCHKSSAPDWAGRILTYRGWPDDWITTKYAFTPHPALGLKPDVSIPIVPIMSPGMVWAMQSKSDIVIWKKTILTALNLACHGGAVPDYTRPYFEITLDPGRVREVMLNLAEHPAVRLTFDTETSGLKQYSKKQTVVYMMFRWDENGAKRTIGFPWDYEGSPMKPYLNELSEYILRAVYANKLCGHNLTFDMLWLHATMPGANLDKLANAMDVDTMHMLYALKQARGSRGLELVAYDWCPEMAGYEEEMVLFIDKYHELLSPEEGGHYANWDGIKTTEPKISAAFTAYVMGDVEVAHETANRLEAKLNEFSGHQIPLASLKNRGKFRLYTTPARSWVFKQVLCPAARTLYKMMARGMHVNADQVAYAEDVFPKKLKESVESLVNLDPRITDWVHSQQATEQDWEFDLEKSDQLKTVLFRILGLDVQRLTESGIKIFGDLDHCTNAEDRIKYAATDKYTLTRLISDHPVLKPLQDYKKLFKAYSGYVRPMRNSFLAGFDKKEREKTQHLMPDSCVHGSFLLTGTRGGRLCVDEDTVLDVVVDGKQASVAIKDLKNLNMQHVSIMTHKLRQRRITRLIQQGRQYVYKVILETGEEISCTANHRLFTPAGWKHLYELERGDSVYTYSRPGRSDIGLEVHAGPNSETANDHCRFSQIRPVQEVLATFPKLVETGLIGRISKTGISPAVSTSAWKQEWLPSTVDNNPETSIGTVYFPGSLHREDGGAVQHELLYSCAESSAVCYPRNRKVSGKSSELISGTVENARGDLSWNCSNISGSGARPRGICKKAVSSVHEADAYGQLCEGYCKSEDSISKKSACSRTGRDLVQRKPARDDAGAGIDASKDSVPARVCMGGVQAGGFSDQREVDCGNRRGIPYQQSECAARREDRTVRILNDSIYNETGQVLDAESAGMYSAKIIDIIPIGKRRVYDITVDEDHSYIAQGFVNHNCSKDPNLQQLPHDGEVKRFYDSRFGKRGCLYNGDLSQIELRLLAAACGDPVMTKAYCDGVDLHTLTTSRIFHTDYDVYTKQHMAKLQEEGHGDVASKLDMQRKIGKTTNFLTGYGGGPAGLQGTLAENGIYISVEEAEKILAGFFESYPTLAEYLSVYKRFVLKNGVAVSITGRVREFNEVFSDDKRLVNKALRAGCNHLIQSTASDMMLTALNAIEFIMREENMESMLVSTVHDSLLIDAVRDEMPRVHEICNEILNNIPGVMRVVYGDDFDVSWTTLLPFNGDFDIGNNYLDMIKVPDNPDWNEIWKRIDAEVA